jgi:tellurite resistance protein TehA-like permease
MAPSPGAFAVVMATGICSVASRRQLPDISIALLWVGIAAFIAVALRVARRELGGHGRSPRPATRGWFDALTFVAAAAVIADRLGHADHKTAQLILSVAAVAVWVVPAFAIARRSITEPSLVMAHASGSWLLSVVATQSVSFIAATRASSDHEPALAVVAALLWMLGIALYLRLVALIAPITLSLVRAGRFQPDLWIAMGALAITTLGASAISLAPDTFLRQAVRLGGLAAWTTALGLLPLLFACDAHVARQTRLSWPDSGRWSMVFPLGMLAAASQAYGTAESDQLISRAGQWMTWVALAAWLSVAVGVIRNRIVSPRR